MENAVSSDIKKFIANHLGTTEFEIVQLAGDASARKYYRVGWTGSSQSQSLVLMYWEPFPDDGSYPFINVQNHFLKHNVRVPQIEAVAAHLGCLLQEDLGDLTLERKFWENQNQELAWPFYFQAVDELIKIHYHCSKPESKTPVCQQVVFDTAKFMWEMNYAREHLLEKFCGIKLSSADQATLQSEFLKVCTTLDQQPKFVCHRDYHSRNLMLKMGKVRVIDFQDARRGPIQYDLVSLVYDSYVAQSQFSIEKIKNDYLQKAKAENPKAVDWGSFEEIFKIQTIQRCFKACGSFSSFFNMRDDNRYIKYIAPTAKLVLSTLEETSGGGAPMPLLTSLLRNHELCAR